MWSNLGMYITCWQDPWLHNFLQYKHWYYLPCLCRRGRSSSYHEQPAWGQQLCDPDTENCLDHSFCVKEKASFNIQGATISLYIIIILTKWNYPLKTGFTLKPIHKLWVWRVGLITTMFRFQQCLECTWYNYTVMCCSTSGVSCANKEREGGVACVVA